MVVKKYKGNAIGIDLGTTYSCVAVWQEQKCRAEIIHNEQGNRITPSCVAFTDSQRLIGDAAKNQAASNATNTVFEAKRLIGRKYSDPVVQNDMKLWPFKVTSDNGDKPMIVVNYKGEEKYLAAEEISSMILTKMREIAEAFLEAPLCLAQYVVLALTIHLDLNKEVELKQTSPYASGSESTRAMQNQLVCNGCRSVLLYPRGATNVCCALCNTITSVPPPGMEMSQLYCGGCRTLLMYPCGATSVRCSCCHTVNLAPASNPVAHIHCGNCRTTLMYPYGAPSVKCAICHYITNVGMTNGRLPFPVHSPNGTTNSATVPSTTTSMPQSQSQTVVVENPMSVDSNGKLVSNVVVGVTTDKK
ncbi:hypothetical protein RIF29_42218 [Crotalaria pallida]|uniref:Zinc finger LSD1-type domain-containing protein n=1 Tax=Crotalaria pallida TaxID=3830 RepID=A0AAN9HTF7_CROPI